MGESARLLRNFYENGPDLSRRAVCRCLRLVCEVVEVFSAADIPAPGDMAFHGAAPTTQVCAQRVPTPVSRGLLFEIKWLI